MVVVVVGLSIDVDDDGHNTEWPVEIHREPEHQTRKIVVVVVVVGLSVDVDDDGRCCWA